MHLPLAFPTCTHLFSLLLFKKKKKKKKKTAGTSHKEVFQMKTSACKDGTLKNKPNKMHNRKLFTHSLNEHGVGGPRVPPDHVSPRTCSPRTSCPPRTRGPRTKCPLPGQDVPPPQSTSLNHFPAMGSWAWGLRTRLAEQSHAEDGIWPCYASSVD